MLLLIMLETADLFNIRDLRYVLIDSFTVARCKVQQMCLQICSIAPERLLSKLEESCAVFSVPLKI